MKCQARDEFDEVSFADKRGRVFSYTCDYLSPSIVKPLIKVVIDFDGGGRGLFPMTECDGKEIQIDMPVEMTFRYLLEAGIRTYTWRCRPVREERD